MKCAHLQCDRTVKASQLCRSHYRRMTEGKSIAWPLKMQRRSDEICSLPGCPGDAFLLDLCVSHWRRERMAEITHDTEKAA